MTAEVPCTCTIEVPAVSPVEGACSFAEAMSLPKLLRGGTVLAAGLRNCRMCSSVAPRRLRVLVDMDGVLADFEGGFLKKYRTRYPQEPYIELEDRRGFWVSEQYEHLKLGLSEKAISIWESKNFFLELDPIDGAVEAVKEMSELPNTDVFICTSPIKRYQYCPYEKYAWVEKHFGHEYLEHIILTRDKTVVSADLLIDDRPDVTGAEANPTWEHILFTACHNRHPSAASPVRRLQSWRDNWKAILDSRRSQLFEGCRLGLKD
ncbi:5'(3')-deoxyribonucleotidase, mitochondrial [Hyperolius riggenbachi]|uniref:5'(3')-deoxyribonucleotidase, mitochondrial n=1 Tax=Hyperolius riggenbachi TaxID=752182 RepID=UPI0035A35339